MYKGLLQLADETAELSVILFGTDAEAFLPGLAPTNLYVSTGTLAALEDRFRRLLGRRAGDARPADGPWPVAHAHVRSPDEKASWPQRASQLGPRVPVGILSYTVGITSSAVGASGSADHGRRRYRLFNTVMV